MKRNHSLLMLCIMVLCVTFAVVLFFSEALIARHECIDDHCALCAIANSIKFVFFAIVCALVSVTCVFDMPRAEVNSVKCFTLVSSKAKLTI